jgi:hypothetical protein
MANIDDYNAKIEAINAIADDKIIEPVIPIEVFLQEAENLYQWSKQDKTALAAIGITEAKINELPVRAGACREAQSRWFKDRNSQMDAQREWAEKGPGAFALRDELLHAFRYAFRADAALVARVAEIADGTTNADMVQDLNDLSVLGSTHQDLLTPIGVTPEKIQLAADTSDEMANLLALANGDKASQNESKKVRDKAYTYLKEQVDEIREAGKFLFWKNERRYKGYVSKYWSDQNQQKPEAPVENTTT